MNIIIKTPKFIGDTIMMLPALFLLQDYFKDAKFTIICNPQCEALFRDLSIEKIIIDDTRGEKRVSKSLKLLKKLRENSYDLGILFHNAFSSALLFKLAKVDKIIGYKNEGRGFLLDYSLKISRTYHYINHYANLVNHYLNDPYTTLPTIKLHTQKQTYFQPHKHPTIALVLGSEKGTRGYPQDLSTQLSLLLKNRPYQIILLGDSQDRVTNSHYASLMPEAINLSGKTDISEFIDIIAAVDLLVTIDTSAMHIAAATGTKFITLLGHGTSAFSVVKPKVDFGSYLYKGEDSLIDSEQIRTLSPQCILDEIEKRLI